MNDRTRFIGGSDIAAVLGISPWKTPVDLWLDKTAPRTAEEPSKPKSRGSRLEPYVCDMIESEYSIAIEARNKRYIDPTTPHFAAEIDAETMKQPPLTSELRPVGSLIENIEIKTVHPFKARDWGEVDTDELPIHYVAQAQWGLGVTGRDVCHVFPLIGDDLRHYVVARDQETIDAMRERADQFWQRYVLERVRPPMDFAHSNTIETLRRLYPGTDGSTIEATAMHEHWRAVLQTATEARDRYDGVITGARAHIMAQMGNAALLKFSDGKAFRRKLTARKGFTVEPTSFMDLRLINVKGDE